jgi:hypothetical protein
LEAGILDDPGGMHAQQKFVLQDQDAPSFLLHDEIPRFASASA